MADSYKNFAVSAVATAPSPATSGTSLVVTTGQGTRFPTPPFNASVWPTGALPDPSNAEIIRVTAIATDTLTITRAQEGTSARTIVVGDLLAATITKQMLDDRRAALIFRPQANEPPASAYATLDTRNAHPVLDFDGATDEEAVWTGVLPAGYAGGGLTVQTWWALTSATSGSLRVQAAIERMDVSSLSLGSDSFAAFQSAGGSAPGTTGQLIQVSVTLTSGAQMDDLAAGEAFRLKIRRDADGTSGTDDIVTDAELVVVVVKET